MVNNMPPKAAGKTKTDQMNSARSEKLFKPNKHRFKVENHFIKF